MEESNQVQSDYQKRAELRKRKILERSEERMTKILGYKAELADLDTGPTDSDFVHPTSHGFPTNVQANQGDDSTAREEVEDDVMDEEESKYREQNQQFPRKVSLISTPIDFRQQQSKRNSSYSILTPLLKLNSQMLLTTFLLILTAVFSSYYRFNCVVPFILTQSFRYVYLTTSSNIVHTASIYNLTFELISELLIFTFAYVVTQALAARWVLTLTNLVMTMISLTLRTIKPLLLEAN